MSNPTTPARTSSQAPLAVSSRTDSANTLFSNSEGAGFGVLERNVLRALYRYRWLIVLCFVVMTTLVAVIVRALPASYEAEARILIRTETQGNPSFLSGVAAVGPRSGMDSPERRLETEMQMTASRAVVTAAVQETKVSYDQVYHAPLTHLLAPAMSVYEWAGQKWFGFPPSDRKSEPSVIEAVQQSLTVGPVKNKSAEVTSNLILLKLPATTPEIAQTLLSSIVRQYLALQNGMASREVLAALEAVRNEQAQATRQADSARQQLQRFLGASPRAAASGGVTSASAEAIDRLRAALLDAELKLGDARNVFREESDTISRLNARIGSIKSQLRSEAGQSASSDTRAEDLRAKLRSAELRQSELTRKANEIELLSQAAPLVGSDRMLIDAPALPRSSDWKKRAAILVAGCIGGVLLGLLLAGVVHMLDHGLRSPDDVRIALGTPPLGVIPHSPKSARELQALALRVATVLEQQGEGRDQSRLKIVLITSARAREGRTFIAQGIMHHLEALPGVRVRLALNARSVVPADIAASRLASVRSAAIHDALPVRAVVTVAPPGASTLAASVSTDRAGLTEQHVLVVDGAELPTGESDELATQADLILFVVDSSRTGRQTVVDSLGYLSTISKAPVSVVLNKAERDLPSALLDRL